MEILMESEIIKIFEEIKEEARTGEVKIPDDSQPIILRILFNIVDDEIKTNIPSFYIKNKDNFYRYLIEYINKALKFYNLESTYNNIKMLLSFLVIKQLFVKKEIKKRS